MLFIVVVSMIWIDNYENFDHSVREFLDHYLEAAAEPEDARVTEMISIFDKTMLFAKQHLPLGFRKTERSKTTPRVRFEALAAGIALALIKDPGLAPNSIADWLYSADFKAMSKAPNSTKQVNC